MAWLPKKAQFSAGLVLSIFAPVLDLSSVSSVLQMSALKHSIPKRNIKKYTGQFALFCRGRLKRNQ